MKLRLQGIRVWVASVLCMGAISGGSLLAQSSADLNEGSVLTKGNPGWDFDWWGRLGRTYFVQTSEDLVEWEYMPFIEAGASDVLGWAFNSTADRFFVRLKYTDVPVADVDTADFDFDGVGNADELAQTSDPFTWADSDADGLPDDWEMFWWGNLAASASGINSATGLTHLTSFLERRSPLEGAVTSLPEAVSLVVYSSLE